MALLDDIVEAMKEVPTVSSDFRSYTRDQARAALKTVAKYVDDEYQRGAGDDQYVALGNVAVHLLAAGES